MSHQRFSGISWIIAAIVVIVIIKIRLKKETRETEPVNIQFGPPISESFQWAQPTPDLGEITSPTTEGPIDPVPSRTVTRVADVVENFSKLIAEEMEGHTFLDPHRKHLSDYIPAKGGRPLHYYILSTWESQHTLLGDLINTLPGSFYFFEPLERYGTVQLNETLATRELTEIRSLMNCNFKDAPKFMKTLKVNSPAVRKNTRLWAACSGQRDFCVSREFLRVRPDHHPESLS